MPTDIHRQMRTAAENFRTTQVERARIVYGNASYARGLTDAYQHAATSLESYADLVEIVEREAGKASDEGLRADVRRLESIAQDAVHSLGDVRTLLANVLDPVGPQPVAPDGGPDLGAMIRTALKGGNPDGLPDLVVGDSSNPYGDGPCISAFPGGMFGFYEPCVNAPTPEFLAETSDAGCGDPGDEDDVQEAYWALDLIVPESYAETFPASADLDSERLAALRLLLKFWRDQDVTDDVPGLWDLTYAVAHPAQPPVPKDALRLENDDAKHFEDFVYLTGKRSGPSDGADPSEALRAWMRLNAIRQAGRDSENGYTLDSQAEDDLRTLVADEGARPAFYFNGIGSFPCFMAMKRALGNRA